MAKKEIKYKLLKAVYSKVFNVYMVRRLENRNYIGFVYNCVSDNEYVFVPNKANKTLTVAELSEIISIINELQRS